MAKRMAQGSGMVKASAQPQPGGSGVAPVPVQLQPAPQTAPAPTMPYDTGVQPTMQGSLPPIAAGGDSYTRQFYGGANLPKRRFLPVGLVPGKVQ